jgi:hypothetical protein
LRIVGYACSFYGPNPFTWDISDVKVFYPKAKLYGFPIRSPLIGNRKFFSSTQDPRNIGIAFIRIRLYLTS